MHASERNTLPCFSITKPTWANLSHPQHSLKALTTSSLCNALSFSIALRIIQECNVLSRPPRNSNLSTASHVSRSTNAALLLELDPADGYVFDILLKLSGFLRFP
jgi:hypothetical protein